MSQPARPTASPLSEMTPASAKLLRNALARVGCRYTTQRAAVYAYLEGSRSHPTADEVYRAVSDDVPQISLATVYNALETLVEVQLATRLEGTNNTARYDSCPEDHYHLRDTVTGEIRDLTTPFDAELLDRIDPKLRETLDRDGFEVTGYRLEVLGQFRKTS